MNTYFDSFSLIITFMQAFLVIYIQLGLLLF